MNRYSMCFHCRPPKLSWERWMMTSMKATSSTLSLTMQSWFSSTTTPKRGEHSQDERMHKYVTYDVEREHDSASRKWGLVNFKFVSLLLSNRYT